MTADDSTIPAPQDQPAFLPLPTSSRFRDLTGSPPFGRLTVLGFVGIRDRYACWLCRCECGKTVVVKGVALTGGRQSCGCLISDRPGKPTDETPEQRAERLAILRAKNKAVRKTPAGAAMFAWSRLTARAGAKYNFSRCYVGVEVRISREDFIAWAVPQYEAWFRDHPDLTPSVDRIESTGHYEVGNLRLIERVENITRSSHFKNRKAPSGQAWCGACKRYLAVESFTVDKQKKTGRCTYCRSCAPVVRQAQEARRRARSQHASSMDARSP